MAADFTNLRIGQLNQVGTTEADNRALFLKLYSGEVLRAFNNKTVMQGRIRTRRITGGKSAQFPLTGQLTARYHQPGTSIDGQNANNNERVINVDKLLISDVFIPNIDEAMSHFDYRGIYSQEAGEALAQKYDKNLLQLAVLAARATAINASHPAGTQLNTDANVATVAANLKLALEKAAQTLDEKNCPESGRTAVLRPAQYWLLFGAAASGSVMNRDIGGAGSAASGNLPEYAGIGIVKSNNIPSTNISSNTDEQNTYTGDFTKTVAPVFHADAIGTVSLIGIQTEMESSVRYQGTLVVAKYAMGHGILRPQVALEIATP